jgi:hypothetical protein
MADKSFHEQFEPWAIYLVRSEVYALDVRCSVDHIQCSTRNNDLGIARTTEGINTRGC